MLQLATPQGNKKPVAELKSCKIPCDPLHPNTLSLKEPRKLFSGLNILRFSNLIKTDDVIPR